MGHIPYMEQLRNSYKVLVRTPHEKKLLWRPKCKCLDNIKMDLKDEGWVDMDWTHVARYMD